MHLTVVIAVRDRRAELARCLAAIAPQAGPDCEIIVVDNGSSEPMIALPDCARLLTLGAGNRCAARNAGAEAAAGAWVAFTDSDCVPESGWIAALQSAARAAEGEAGVFGIAGEIVDAPATNTVEAFIARRRWIDNAKFLQPGRRFAPPFAATANLMVRRAEYLRLGGLDEQLAAAGEDADLCWRAAGAGGRVAYCADARVVHHHRSTLGGLWRQAYAYGYGNAELFARWRGEWGARCWIEPRLYAWAAKGFLKWPWRMMTGTCPAEKMEPFYDGVANIAMIAGRIAGGVRHGVLVL